MGKEKISAAVVEMIMRVDNGGDLGGFHAGLGQAFEQESIVLGKAGIHQHPLTAAAQQHRTGLQRQSGEHNANVPTGLARRGSGGRALAQRASAHAPPAKGR